MVAESGARLLDRDAQRGARGRSLPRGDRRDARTSPRLGVLAGDDSLDAEGLARAVQALGPRGRRRHRRPPRRGGRRPLRRRRPYEIPGERYPDGAAHGSGCTHSSTLAARLALGDDLLEAATRGQAGCLRGGPRRPAGHRSRGWTGQRAGTRHEASAERRAAFDIIAEMKFLRMKPGHGEVLIAEGDVDVAGTRSASWRSSAASSTRACGPRCPTGRAGRPARGADGQGASTRSRATPTASSSSRAPPAAPEPGRPRERRQCSSPPVATAHRHRGAAVGPRCCPPVARGASSATARRRGDRAGHGLRPGPRAARRAARPRAPALVRQRRGVGDVPRPRLHPGLGRDGAGAEAAGVRRRTRAPARRTRTSIYPHKPIVAYLPQTRELLNEYCVAFPDETRPYGSARLPDSDDVLAKWMALTGDERRLIATANMHLPGPAGRPQAGPPRPLAPQPVGARAGSRRTQRPRR